MDNLPSNTRAIDPSDSINAAVLAKIKVHNTAGECAVSLVHPLAKELFRQSGEGHYMLCTEHGQDPLASVTVRADGVTIYSERLAHDLPVGEHPMTVVWRIPLNEKPAIRSPGLR